MRFALGDVRGLIVLDKNDYGPSYRSYGALQRWERLGIDFREIFSLVRFSTFSTVSAMSGPSITTQYANPLLELSRALPRSGASRASPKVLPEFMERTHPFALTRRYHRAQGIAEDRRKASKIAEVW
jgi:hypothetical protein